MMRNIKQYLFVALSVILSVVILAGCGNEPSKSGHADKTNKNKVTLKQVSGETRVIGNPKRIVVTDYRLADSLLALGTKPYGMTSYMGSTELPYLNSNALRGVKNLGDEPNLEAILQAKPDLIISRDSQSKIYNDLSKIAPTITSVKTDDWRSDFQSLAKMLHKETAADKWLDHYDNKVKKAKGKLIEKIGNDKTALYMRTMPKEYRIYGSDQFLGSTLSQLGLKPVPQVKSIEKFEDISMEQLIKLNPDYIFLEVGGPVKNGDKEAEKQYKELSQTPIWKSLKAVKNNHVYTVPHWVISDYPLIKSKSVNLVLKKLKVD